MAAPRFGSQDGCGTAGAELEAGNQSSRPLTDAAFIHAVKGNKEEALRGLRKAVDAGYLGMNNPIWANLHSESRFQLMKAEVDARIAEMRRRVKEMEERARSFLES